MVACCAIAPGRLMGPNSQILEKLFFLEEISVGEPPDRQLRNDRGEKFDRHNWIQDGVAIMFLRPVLAARVAEYLGAH